MPSFLRGFFFFKSVAVAIRLPSEFFSIAGARLRVLSSRSARTSIADGLGSLDDVRIESERDVRRRVAEDRRGRRYIDSGRDQLRRRGMARAVQAGSTDASLLRYPHERVGRRFRGE